MRLPDFLIVGAMKAGTTSLYFDLLRNPAVFMSKDKEPGNLLGDDVSTAQGRHDYARLFKRARPGQICGEASTGYTKLPEHAGVPDRARCVAGSDLKVIYLVREPVSRIMSQHHHELVGDMISCGIDEAVRRYPRFIDYCRYAMQITPWLETFGPQQVQIVRFESYIADRRGVVDTVSRFLGIPPYGDRVETDVVYNRSDGKPVREGPFEPVRMSTIYRKFVRPMLSRQARESLRRLLLPKTPDRAESPSAATVNHIVDALADDVRRLSEIMGTDEPVWNLGVAPTTDANAPRKAQA